MIECEAISLDDFVKNTTKMSDTIIHSSASIMELERAFEAHTEHFCNANKERFRGFGIDIKEYGHVLIAIKTDAIDTQTMVLMENRATLNEDLIIEAIKQRISPRSDLSFTTTNRKKDKVVEDSDSDEFTTENSAQKSSKRTRTPRP